MASLMSWALAILVGFIALQLGGAIVSALGIGSMMQAVLMLVALGASVMLAVRVKDRDR